MNHDEIWNAIDSFATEHRMSCSGLAKTGGLNPTTFSYSKRWSKYGQERWPSMQSISKILTATDKEFADFVKFIKKENEGKETEEKEIEKDSNVRT